MDILKKISTAVSEKTGIPIEVISDTPKLELTGRKSLYIENHKGIKVLTDTSVAVRTAGFLIYAEGINITIKEIDKEHIKVNGVFTSLRFEKQE